MNCPASGSRYIVEGRVRSEALQSSDPRWSHGPFTTQSPSRLPPMKSSRGVRSSTAAPSRVQGMGSLLRGTGSGDPKAKSEFPDRRIAHGAMAEMLRPPILPPLRRKHRKVTLSTKAQKGARGMQVCRTATTLLPGMFGCRYGRGAQVQPDRTLRLNEDAQDRMSVNSTSKDYSTSPVHIDIIILLCI
jgi:hypothetical protein